jgi:hypothetical protein
MPSYEPPAVAPPATVVTSHAPPAPLGAARRIAEAPESEIKTTPSASTASPRIMTKPADVPAPSRGVLEAEPASVTTAPPAPS